MKKTTGCLIRRGKTFHASWTHNGKNYRYSTGCTTRKEAQKVLDDMIAPFLASTDAAVLEAIQGRAEGSKAEAARLLEEQTPVLRIADTWSAFKDSQSRPDCGQRTLDGYESHWLLFKKWMAQTHPEVEHLRDVTPEHAAEYAKRMQVAKWSASTINQKRNFLHLMWRCLTKEARLTCNPWDGIARKKLTALAFRKKALTADQFRSLLAAAEDHQELRDLLTLLAWTGLRMGDGACLQWSAVSFANGTLTVTPRKTERRQGKQVFIPMFPTVRELLERRQAGLVLNPKAPVFPEMAEMYERDNAALSKRITAAFDKAGMVTTEERNGRGRNCVVYGAHSLRHFFVTAASAAGLPAPVIRSITGHATDTMMEHYAHITADYAGELAKRITGAPLALPAPAIENAATGQREALPGWARDAVKRALLALDAGDMAGVREQLGGLL